MMNRKIKFDDFPRWLNPKLSHKEIKEAYEREIRRIDERAMRRKNPYYGCCIDFTDYTKYQGGNSFILNNKNE